MADSGLLKKDLFGEIRVCDEPDGQQIARDTAPASPWVRWLARALMRREASALAALEGLAGVPRIIRLDRALLIREFVPGEPMHRARPTDPAYFRRAARLLRQLHGRGVVHNDLAKEPNLLVCADGAPAFVDFQLSWYSRGRGKLFRLLAWDDIRHLLKHKRNYCPQHLSARERDILARPSGPSLLFRRTIKPVYLFVTRRLLGWADREGAGDRGAQQ